MRSSAEQFTAIRQETGHCFDTQVGLWLSTSRSQRGFTLTELITIMVIVGILAVAALPRFFDSNMFQDRGAADQVKAALRYAQKVAIAQRRTAGLTVTITSAATSNCGIALNGAGNIDCVISNGVTVAPALPQSVTFDALGRANAALNITVGGYPIAVVAETGYVQ